MGLQPCCKNCRHFRLHDIRHSRVCVTAEDNVDAATHFYPTAGTARQAAPFREGFCFYPAFLAYLITLLGRRLNLVFPICTGTPKITRPGTVLTPFRGVFL